MSAGQPSVLYLHGLDSAPVAPKTSAIADLGCSVIAPQLHYREVMGTYQRVKQLAQEFQVDWIIGSSLGGYTAFWLSQALQIPTLLFNPALAFRSMDPGLITEPLGITYTRHVIFLGMKDDTVNPAHTKKWLAEHHLSDKVTLIEHPENGHQIGIKVFRETIEKAADLLQITVGEQLLY